MRRGAPRGAWGFSMNGDYKITAKPRFVLIHALRVRFFDMNLLYAESPFS